MNFRVFGTTLALCTAVLSPRPADACRCMTPGEPCDPLWRADAVFVGHVVSIETSTAPRAEWGGRHVELAVVEGFRGLQMPQITLVTGYGQTDCGYPFKMGESYVVYAYQSPQGQLATSICTRTRPVGDAADDLAYARSLATIVPGTLARVAGRVQLSEWPPPADGLKPVPNVVVTATGEGRTFSASANDRGEFVLTGLPLGKYEVIAKAPPGYDAVPRTLDVSDPRGCGTPVLFVRHDGRVMGRVVDSRGVGVGGLPLQLVRPEDVEKPDGSAYRVQAWTSADGTFELRLVPPGRYLLGFSSIRGYEGRLSFPRAFYPGVVEPTSAGTVVMSAGERVRLKNFVVPETIKLVTVSGIVVDEAGQPVRDARISLSDNTEGSTNIGSGFVTGEDGRFAFAVGDGGRYLVHVTRYVGADVRTREVQTSMVAFRASAGTPTMTVVMKPSVR